MANQLDDGVGGWAKTGIACTFLCALAACGLGELNHGMATNRAWVSPCILGAVIACLSPVAFIAMLGAGRGYKSAFLAMAQFVLVGISPAVTVLVILFPKSFHTGL